MQYDLAKNYVSSEEQGGAYEGATYGLGHALAGIGFVHAVICVYLVLLRRPLLSSRCSRWHRVPRPRRVDGATCHAIDAMPHAAASSSRRRVSTRRCRQKLLSPIRCSDEARATPPPPLATPLRRPARPLTYSYILIPPPRRLPPRGRSRGAARGSRGASTGARPGPRRRARSSPASRAPPSARRRGGSST